MFRSEDKRFLHGSRKYEFKHDALLRAVITLKYEKPLVNSCARRLDVKAESSASWTLSTGKVAKSCLSDQATLSAHEIY